MFIPFVIWEARANTWASFCLARTFAALASSFSQTVPPATIADIFIKQVRGSKMSMYGVAVVMAPALAPVFCGLIVNASSWRNIFWFNTGLAALQLVLFFFFVPETLWIADDAPVQETPVELADSQDKNVAVQAEHGQAAVLPTGHVGAAWMPWSRPSEYLGVVMSPILMVGFQRYSELMTVSLLAYSPSFHILWLSICMVGWLDRRRPTDFAASAVRVCHRSSWRCLSRLWNRSCSGQVVGGYRWGQNRGIL